MRRNTIMTIDEALRYIMPFGKYKGVTLLRVFNEDRKYFDEYLSQTAKGRLKEAIDLIVEDSNFRKGVGFSQRRY